MRYKLMLLVQRLAIDTGLRRRGPIRSSANSVSAVERKISGNSRSKSADIGRPLEARQTQPRATVRSRGVASRRGWRAMGLPTSPLAMGRCAGGCLTLPLAPRNPDAERKASRAYQQQSPAHRQHAANVNAQRTAHHKADHLAKRRADRQADRRAQ